jgi:hypothetical protein
MTLLEALTAALIKYHTARVPEHLRHEPEEARVARMHSIAEAEIRACMDSPIPGWPLLGCVALNSTRDRWESGLLLEVHSGQQRGKAGERCFAQVHPKVLGHIRNPKYAITREEFDSLEGTDQEATNRCARAGAKIMAYHAARCHIRFEFGGWSTARLLFAEYHQPANNCRALVTKMSTDRAFNYSIFWRELTRATGAWQPDGTWRPDKIGLNEL